MLTGYLPKRGSVQRNSNIGPRTEPCGTPYSKEASSDTVPSMFTVCCLQWRCDLNHSREMSSTLKSRSSLWRRTLWSIISNAADKPKRITITAFLLSTAPQDVIIYLQESSLHAVRPLVRRLHGLVKDVDLKVWCQSFGDYFLEDFGEERHVRYRPITAHLITI